MSENVFKVQVPIGLIRDHTFSDIGFVLYAKLIQLYYLNNKRREFYIDHTQLMYYLCIRDNRTFKRAYNELHNKGLVLNELIDLPKRDLFVIHMNESLIGNGMFTQVTKNLLDRCVIESIEYTGVRLIYLYESYIIRSEPSSKQYAHPSIETIALMIGNTKKTVVKYNEILEKRKFIKIEKDVLNEKEEYTRLSDHQLIYYTKYNNKYYVKLNNIDKFCDKFYTRA